MVTLYQASHTALTIVRAQKGTEVKRAVIRALSPLH